VMMGVEKICRKETPDLVMVVGDVNSTIAAGLAAKKLNIDLAHVEAGLRSGDRSMPEEINRIATDSISDMFFITESGAARNLLAEGHEEKTIHFVGNVMIDNLFCQLESLRETPPSDRVRRLHASLQSRYFCLTLHRPSNVDSESELTRILTAISDLARSAPVLFVCHPRTRKNISAFGLDRLFSSFPGPGEAVIDSGMYLIEPLGYNDFLFLWKDAVAVLTDSGGLQEETTALRIPCITLRQTTERPVTVEQGSNEIAGTDPERIIEMGKQVLSGKWKQCGMPQKWDGKAGERIAAVLCRHYRRSAR
jgi:UDP-N-acetylglucosamine 2-epimerase (non-hydrolysing)